MAQKIKFGVIFGGRSGEHEVSLMSARSVLSVIDREKYEVYPIGITLEGRWVFGNNLLDTLAEKKTKKLVIRGDYSAILPAPDYSKFSLYLMTGRSFSN